MSSHAPNLRLSRRECLQYGALTALSLPQWTSAEDVGPENGNRLRHFGRAKSVIIVFLFGGPGQQDLWDLKPDGPAEARGEFRPIDTNVSGIRISNQLPNLSRQMDKVTLLRSVTHQDFEHGSASYTALTGHPHPKPGTNTPATKEDFPTYGSIVSRVKPTSKPVPSSIVLGPVMHQGNRPPMAGQNAGFLGKAFDPFRVAEDPNQTNFQVPGLAIPKELSPDRLSSRYELLSRLNVAWQKPSTNMSDMVKLQRRAQGLLGSRRIRQSFDLSKETKSARDAYGRHKFGQTLLLARRLVEVDVPLITVNWSKLNADQWDTHAKNYPRLKKLLPPFDQGMAALLSDLDARGKLDETLVLAFGEFGRTPKMNKNAGRDHWPDCYSILAAGGGLTRGVVFGASDHVAAYPIDDPIGPWDLAATMYHLLGIPPRIPIHDAQGRPFTLSHGHVVAGLLA